MRGKYSDIMLAHKLFAGAGLHQASYALKKYSASELAHNQSINALGGDLRTQCWPTGFGQSQPLSGSTRSHCSMQEKYLDTELAHKLLAWARLHQPNTQSRWSMWEKYSDTVLAHKLVAGPRFHQATHNLLGQCGGDIQTLFWHISLWQGPGSIRQHMLSLYNVLGGDMRTQCWHTSYW